MIKDGKEFNFIRSKIDSDKELFFGPLDTNDTFIDIHDNWTMLDIVTVAGIFSSKSNARSQGWNKPIPEGFSMFKMGKYKALITILNMTDDLENRIKGII